MSWHTLIKDIPDYPKAGIIFKDITPLLADGPGFSAAIEEMAQFCEEAGHRPDVLACPEAVLFLPPPSHSGLASALSRCASQASCRAKSAVSPLIWNMVRIPLKFTKMTSNQGYA